ncbi:hypothetical protein CYY_000365 [Polysphondylium violaceum]|uniref:Dynactin 22 kDa subunit n=1 Tax=Polysphondylium violaceum TaxID=133409 RepID=A0A8J4Q413_9MYCE|nr:hypothetical protein CYY_000365 [Polysphondylium violaceum]
MSQTENLNISIDELESRVDRLEFLLMGCQPNSNDPLLRLALPSLSSNLKKTKPRSSLLGSASSPASLSSSSSTAPSSSSTETICESLEKYKGVLNKLKSENEVINNFISLYKSNESLFNGIVDNDTLLNSVEKLSLILSAEEDIRLVARNLQKLSELEKFIHTNCMDEVPSLIEKIRPIDALNLEQEAIAIQLNKVLEEKIQSYNDIIHDLSSRFAYWDYMISEWEKKYQ